MKWTTECCKFKSSLIAQEIPLCWEYHCCYQRENPALPGSKVISIIKDPLNLEFLNQAKNIPVVLPSFQIKI